MLEAGRERRLSPSSSPKRERDRSPQQQYLAQQQTLRKQEASGRRKRLDEMDRRIQKLARREERISILEEKIALQKAERRNSTDANMTDAEMAELEGLRRVQQNFEEQYDPKEFSKEHIEFKALHNQVFCQLVRWCESKDSNVESANPSPAASPAKVFFLDGPDGGTASYMIQTGDFDAQQCFVANRHESTCKVLRKSGGGLLPEENVIHATCSEALTKGVVPKLKESCGAFSQIDFMGYYFDGCGGYSPHIVNMISSALLVLDGDRDTSNEEDSEHPIVVGYSLLGGTKNLVEKELEISQAVTVIARSRGMRMAHALDDPIRFGLPPDVSKLGGKSGTTFTTWLVLEPDSVY